METSDTHTASGSLALVTGGAGFIGSHITERLLLEGYRVRILDNFSTGKQENIPESRQVEVIEGDVADFGTVQNAMQDVAIAFHEAAIASVPETVGNPLASEQVNYRGTLNVLEAARHAGTRRVMFACSAAVYGDLPELPKQENMPLKPLSPYAVDKLASEHACQMYWHLYGLETVSLRYFNVFGPRQDPSSPYSGVISIFADCLQHGRQPAIYGDGGQTRDFVYVSDVVEANMRAATAPSAPGRAINVATGGTITINDLLRTICNIKDQPFAPRYLPGRQGDIRHSRADISTATEILGWQPEVGFEDGLRKLFDA
ncbi:MAG TPA: SDR family oxidoreductase [Gammaproteobacteria bacterium]|nr:SDR family oxidoreductase [Gammaproteobacteria bacterium]